MKSRLFLFSLAFLSISSLAFAQRNEPPSGQFGLGVFLQGAALPGEVPGGITGTYAIDRNLQIGTYFTLGVFSGGDGSATEFELAPFVRYQFHAAVSPYVEGGFAILAAGGGSTFGMFLGGGLGYYLSQTVGINADLDILDIQFSNPSGLIFGWINTRMGVSWYFGG